MAIVIATPTLFDKTSPFNHLFKDILEAFILNDETIVRLIAMEENANQEYALGIQSDSISYQFVKRRSVKRSNIMLRYITDNIVSWKMSNILKQYSQGDILFEDVTFASFWTVRAAKKNKMKVVAMVQDIWPDNAVSSGILRKDSILYKFFERWQRYIYNVSDRIICISDDMKRFIVSKGVDSAKIDVIYNWGYNDEVVNIPWETNKFVEKYQLSKKTFYAIYAGNIGRMQNVEVVVEAAKLLREFKHIHFLIIGDGVKKEEIIQSVKNNNMENVTILPMQPSELATSIYSAAGVNIIPLVEGGVDTALPSKTGVVLSCGRHTIFGFGDECEFERQLAKYNAGISIGSNDAIALADAIVNYSGCQDMKSDGAIEMFLDIFRKDVNTTKYVGVIKNLRE